MGNFIITIILGALAGWIASMIMKKDAQMGGLANIICGILGSVVGGWIYTAVTNNAEPQGIWQIVWAVIGAVIILWIYNLIAGKNNNHTNTTTRSRR